MLFRCILIADYSGRGFQGLGPALFSIARGERSLTRLSELQVGENAVLIDLALPESVQNHLMHMGFVPEARIAVLRRAPAGDPTVYGVDGMEIALRHETASALEVRLLTEQEEAAGDTAFASSIPCWREAAR